MQKISLSSRKIRGSEDYYFSRVLMTGSQRDNIQDKESLITNQLNSNYQLNDSDYRLEETKKNEFIIIPKTIKCRQKVDDLYITLSVNN
jgi:hypothetical protein